MAEEAALSHLRELLAIPTVGTAESDRFIETVRRLYPRIAKQLEFELVDGHTMLIRWPGTGAGAPAVLMAHYDVVPASDDGWEHPPFAAEVTGEGEDRVLWGRGTLDDKGALVAILEGVEDALGRGFTPANDIWLSFGHDEETFGTGAATAVDLLEQRGVRPALVLDEGGAIVEGVFPGVAKPVAVVGVAEKGIATVTLTVTQQGGHASAPPRVPATVRLSRAVERLNAHPFTPRLTEAVRGMNRVMGREAKGGIGSAFRVFGGFGPFVTRLFARMGDETRAITRTTAVVTMIEAGHAPNALPERAVATINVRILPGETCETVIAHIRRAVADDLVVVELVHGVDPSVASPASGPAWDLLERTILARHPGAVVTPYLMLGATDSRHFTRISDQVYRFSPFEMTSDERTGLHAMNERIRVRTFLDGVEFYRTLIAEL
jgi:carboxypeptidase PM20D1